MNGLSSFCRMGAVLGALAAAPALAGDRPVIPSAPDGGSSSAVSTGGASQSIAAAATPITPSGEAPIISIVSGETITSVSALASEVQFIVETGIGSASGGAPTGDVGGAVIEIPDLTRAGQASLVADLRTIAAGDLPPGVTAETLLALAELIAGAPTID